MSKRICCFVGWPGSIGGAGSESFETQKMFCRHGIEVHCVPTWEAPPPDRRHEVEAAGVQIHDLKPPQLPGLLRDLGGPPVVSFINEKFLPHAYRIRELSPWIHLPCMTYVHSWERVAFKKCGLPDALVFQSEYQREVYHTGLLRHGYRDEIGHSIRGAFEFADWHYRPLAREPSTPFVVGRISRADPSKWNGQLFGCLDPVPNVRAVLMGADEAVRRNIGRRKYATVWPPGQMPARQFYAQLHAQVAMNGGAKENWPRVGLESMALGVPLVVDGHWGWPEMVQHGQTGFLCRHAREFADCLQALERDEALRLQIAEQARWSLEHVLANPAMIWRGWCDLFGKIGAGHLAEEPDYGPSPIQPSVEQLAMMRVAQKYAEDVMDATAFPQFIAGERIEPGAMVGTGPDGRVYNMGLDPAAPGGDRTEILYLPGEELPPACSLEDSQVPDDEPKTPGDPLVTIDRQTEAHFHNGDAEMADQIVRNVPIFGVQPDARRADGTPVPIDREVLQRIAETMTRKMENGWRPALTSCGTANPGDDRPLPQVLGHVENPRVVGDVLVADLVWLDQHVDQIPIRRWMTPELWTDRKTGEQWLDPVVAHATKEEIRPGYSWIPIT